MGYSRSEARNAPRLGQGPMSRDRGMPMTSDSTAAAPGPGPGALERARWGARLAALASPEWLPLVAVMAVPALLLWLSGNRPKASFFGGAAVYAGVLQWLGWAAFGRWSAVRPRFLLFAAELFAGLAVVCTWFYFRNLIARVTPAPYGLGELALLAPLLGVLHIVVGLAQFLRARRSGLSLREVGREAAARLAVYGPFAAVLAVVLWRVSDTIYPHTVDPLLHAFTARGYIEAGIGQPFFDFEQRMVYPSGFATVVATAASLSPLSLAQAVNLAHVFWLAAAVYLVALTVAALAGVPGRLAGLVSFGFLLAVPLGSLYPDNLYSGTPRQMAVALLAAVSLLPLLTPVRPVGAFVAAGGLVGTLGVLAAAMNPACIPFAAFSLLLALLVFAARARAGLAFRAVLGQVGLTLTAAALVFSCDPYYRDKIEELAARREATDDVGPNSGPPKAADLALLLRRSLVLAPNGSVTSEGAEAEALLWAERWPYRAIPVAALVLAGGAVALVFFLRRHSRPVPISAAVLMRFLLGCLAAWLLLKPAVLAACQVTAEATGEAELLSPYMGFVLLRWELLWALAVALASATVLWRGTAKLPSAAPAVVRVATVAGVGLIVYQVASGAWPRSGDPVVRTGNALAFTADDLRLVAWCDEHIPSEKGFIGMAAVMGRAGRNNAERHVTGLGGMGAFLLHGKGGNYRFTMRTLEGDGWAAYRDHVHDRFDAAWCLRNGITHFYASPLGLQPEINPGLHQAVATGQLQEVVRFGASALYAVASP